MRSIHLKRREDSDMGNDITFYKFTSAPDGYRCNVPLDQSGEYVRREEYERLKSENARLKKRVRELEYEDLDNIWPPTLR